MLFKATLWTRELSLKKSTGIFTYPHQTVMDRFLFAAPDHWPILRASTTEHPPGSEVLGLIFQRTSVAKMENNIIARRPDHWAPLP
jgi:hypothetical protein